MNQSPLVSVLIPCYNHEAFLDDCLKSLVAQTYENIELLICDDCSPDGSYAKILSWESALRERFSRVEILRNEVNCGVTKNINRMLSVSRGDYIKILASDDAMVPSAVARMVDFMERDVTISVAVVNGVKVPEDRHYPDFGGSEFVYPTPPDFSSDGFMERLARCNPVFAPGVMVRRSMYDEYGTYDESLKVEDYEYWLRLLKGGRAKFAYLDECLLYYRINANSMTSLSGNDGLAIRRKRIHSSELDTLEKYRDCFSPDVYAEIVLMRIFRELWLAVEYHLDSWEKELSDAWKKFPYRKDLSRKNQRKFRWLYFRQSVKRFIRR